MRVCRCVVATILLFSAWIIVSAQDSGPAGAALPTGLRIPAILRTSISSNKSRVGDPVRLEVVADVHDKTGNVVIHRHANLFGKVTYAVPYERNKQPASLSFAADRGEWKHQSFALDAAIFGVYALASDSPKGEKVEDVAMATLRNSDAINIINSTVMYDLGGGGFPLGPAHDISVHSVIMQLRIVTDPAVRTAFVNDKQDIEFQSFLVLLLNGMKVVQ
jgi:hypothetical protein